MAKIAIFHLLPALLLIFSILANAEYDFPFWKSAKEGMANWANKNVKMDYWIVDLNSGKIKQYWGNILGGKGGRAGNGHGIHV